MAWNSFGNIGKGKSLYGNGLWTMIRKRFFCFFSCSTCSRLFQLIWSDLPRLAVSAQGTCRWAEQSDLFGSSVHYDKRAIESFYSFCRQGGCMSWNDQRKTSQNDQKNVAQFCLLCVKSLKKLTVVCTGLTLLWICWPHLPHACYSNQWCGGRVWIITLSRFPCHIFLDTGVHRLLLTLNFRLFLSRARAHCVQGRLKFCILSFARVIDIDATAAKQVKTSVDKAARTWRRGCVCQTCRTVERKWKVQRQVYDCLWSCLSSRMPNRFRFVLGVAGFWFLKLLSGVGCKSFSAECRAASFRRSSLAVRFLCFSLKGIWHGCTFFISSTSFLQVPLPSKICPCLFTFWSHTFTNAQRSRVPAKGSSLVNPNDFKCVGVPPFCPLTLTAYVHMQCSLYITVHCVSVVYIYLSFMPIFRSFYSCILHFHSSIIVHFIFVFSIEVLPLPAVAFRNLQQPVHSNRQILHCGRCFCCTVFQWLQWLFRIPVTWRDLDRIGRFWKTAVWTLGDLHDLKQAPMAPQSFDANNAALFSEIGVEFRWIPFCSCNLTRIYCTKPRTRKAPVA